VIVLDTHVWLWWLANATELPLAMSNLISAGNEPVAVASMSCLEVAWLAKKGRIVLPVPVDQFFESALDRAGLQLLPLTPKNVQ
jgi:PIN domain nuclease of toxin-antitoxin system